jgi:hypothetical protein
MNGDVIGSFDWEGTESQCANYALMLKGFDCRRGMMDARIWFRHACDKSGSQGRPSR